MTMSRVTHGLPLGVSVTWISLMKLGLFSMGLGTEGLGHCLSYHMQNPVQKKSADTFVPKLNHRLYYWCLADETFARIPRHTTVVKNNPVIVMKTIYIFFAAVLATAASVFAAAPAAVNTRVEVLFDHPEKFTDVKDSFMGTDKGRDSYLALFKEYLEQRAPRYLADGQTLTITFTDIDLAGDFEPQRGPNFSDVRIVKDIYPPRLKFSYKVVDASGAVVKEGQEKLVDLSFQMTSSPIDQQDPLHYEKSMLNDWLHSQFAHPKKVAEKN